MMYLKYYIIELYTNHILNTYKNTSIKVNITFFVLAKNERVQNCNQKRSYCTSRVRHIVSY